jgi:hypothetical protein
MFQAYIHIFYRGNIRLKSGGTGVTPVVSGVAPETDGICTSLLLVRPKAGERAPPQFGVTPN